MWALFKKEILIYFKTPLAYLFLALFLFFTGAIFTLSHIFKANQNFPAYLQVLTSMLAIIAPLLTMRSYSEEWQHKTDQLLFTQPIALHHIVIAKFLSILVIFGIILLVLLLYLSVIATFGTPDWMHIFTAFIGFVLFAITLLSLGMMVSSYTQHQLIAAIVSFLLITMILLLTSIAPIIPRHPLAGFLTISLLLSITSLQLYLKRQPIWLILGSLALIWLITTSLYLLHPSIYQGFLPTFLQQLSPLHRYQGFNQGVIRLEDATYFLLAIFLLQYMIYTNLEKHDYREK
ncbi:ABC transporter permease [Entomospira culicis]|uniref:ABC transporter permease subunit n=1 Tax=Entomospira culicis TaxID=2719989 RepID=A0A968GHB2_9SPIO|nr:ABC transporter permease subunit [Entomospira culicis]NIZ19254.1 ABC transporter permease subunit [Entomospira culicis]NIZ69841.1 ABC transporter permease subunit [Entomospira culicis]WDI36947.1 ABC transporter permease subunit [Entomospira culicis]WDI38576.1 ABC transporter permease subunit [Entomospira culicis]